LQEAGYDIISVKGGSYYGGRPFEDAELKLLIDSVLCSKHISPTYTKQPVNMLSFYAVDGCTTFISKAR
jgi:hypothetical protein